MYLSRGWEVWCLIICITATSGVYHKLSMKPLTFPNLTEDSNFGYSVTYQAATSQLIVGAPKADVIGQIYLFDINECMSHECNVTSIATPQMIVNNAENISSSVVSHKYFLHGATVKARSDSILTCAPKNAQLSKENGTLKVLGLCFDNFSNGTNRLLDYDELTQEYHSKPYGWSVDVTRTNAVIVGGPAIDSGFVKVIKEDHRYNITMPNTNFASGYSVASGNYIETNKTNSSLYYAVSSPYGVLGIGKVSLFDANDLQYVASLDGDIGSLFGASLCTVNLGERLDRLLVGAPTYTDDNIIDRGVVYLYTSNYTNFAIHKTIDGPSNSVYFGSCIANLGDLDGDKKDEVAIGAPYEDLGRGAVYIYSGARLLDPKQSGQQMLLQRIQPEPNSGIRSFGFSLTSIQDYDDNGCNELAVGAPHADYVVVYRCFACITIRLQAKFPTKDDIQQTQRNQFGFQSCVFVQYPEKPKEIDENILIQVNIKHVGAWFEQNNSKTSTMQYEVPIGTKQDMYCKNITFTTNPNANFDEKVSYMITASLKDNPHEIAEFNSSRVVLSTQSTVSLTGQESLADCKGQTCKPKLTMEYNSSMPTPYTVGSTTEETFSFRIRNDGDPAYSACLLVEINGAPLLWLPQGCIPSGNNVTCTPTVLLRNQTDWETGNIVLDTRDLTSRNEKINISYQLYQRCTSTIRSDQVHSDEKNYNLTMSAEGINIAGESDLGDVVEIFSEPTQGRHIYTIMNSGLATWEDVNMDIGLINETNFVTYENLIVELEDVSQVFCPISKNESRDEFAASCKPVELKKGNKLRVIVPFVVTPVDGMKDITTQISTKLTLHLRTNSKLSSVVTKLEFKTSTVPEWIIVTAVLLSTLLVLILGYALFSFGFLKRKNKAKLKKLKNKMSEQDKKSTSNVYQDGQGDKEINNLLSDESADMILEQEETRNL